VFFSLVDATLSKLQRGCVRLDFGSTRRVYGRPDDGLEAAITVHDGSFFRDVVLHGEVGLGQSYVARKWSSSDLGDLALVLLLNLDVFRPVATAGTLLLFPSAVMEWLTQRRLKKRRRTSLENSRKGMAISYDVGNDFFELMLGPTMLYSCAIYPSPDRSLEEAQHHKLDVLIEKADVADGHRVLDIGCGWGTLLEEVRSRYDCTVHGISLSQRQLEYCRTRVPRARFDYIDYRELDEVAAYDRIVSVGMIEHVGADQLEVFMGRVERLLKLGGRAVLHTMIGGDLLDIPAGKQLSSFSTRTIMPIGYVPNPEELTRAIAKTKSLHVAHSERFGPHYGKTMREWRCNILANRALIARRYSEEHVRVYDYVFAMAAACFTSGRFDLLQLVVQKDPITNAMAVYDPRARPATAPPAARLAAAPRAVTG